MKIRVAPLLLLALLLCACDSPVEKAAKLVAGGELAPAESLLTEHLRSSPDAHEARLLLGTVLLKKNDLTGAENHFSAIPQNDANLAKIAAAFREGMRTGRDEEAIAACAYRAFHASKQDEAVCRELVQIADDRRRNDKPFGQLVSVGASFGGRCAATVVEALRGWIPEADTKDVVAAVSKIEELEPEQARSLALALREEASRAEATRKKRARSLLRLIPRIDEEVGGELETVVLRSRLESAGAPVFAATYEPLPTLELYRDGSPEEVTKRVMRYLGKAINDYATDHNYYPPARGEVISREALVPTYIPDLPAHDGWGRRLVYVANKYSARLISAGPDQQVSLRSLDLKVELPARGPDIVWEGAGFVQEHEGFTKAPWQR